MPEFASAEVDAVRERLDEVNWEAAVVALRQMGVFVAPDVVPQVVCESLRSRWDDEDCFERTIDMEPRGYGVGVYRYWKEPLPEPALVLRSRVYAELKGLASEHPHAPPFPRDHAEFMALGRDAGQKRASCILLRYSRGGMNHPHRDIYGPVWFPYQALIVLSRREKEFRGGEFALYDRDENGARVERTLPVDQGDLCLFASRSCRRFVRRRERWVDVEHGMTPVTSGVRFGMGVVMHPAQ
jgi:hypothetical protein